MQTKIDTITLETPLFSLETGRQFNSGEVYLNLKVIIFKNSRLYTLFKKFMDESTTTIGAEPQSLTKYIAKFDDNTQSVAIDARFGKENIIGKFFLETDLDWPKPYYESGDYNPIYKQPVMSFSEELLLTNYGKGVSDILLGRQGIAKVPDAILKLLNNFDPNDQIKKVAPLIVQAYRSSPESRFQFFKQYAFLAEVAHQLDPELTQFDAANKLKNEINISQVFQNNMLAERPFSYKAAEINFDSQNGTHIEIKVLPFFITWLFQFPLGKPVKFSNDFVIFKKSEHVVSFNKGLNTPGIEITNKGSTCFVCNNLKADFSDNSPDDERDSERKKHLTGALTHLYSLSYNNAQPIMDTSAHTSDVPKPKNPDNCAIM